MITSKQMLLIIVTVGMLWTIPAPAQTTGSIIGQVIDKYSKERIPGANIKAKDTQHSGSSDVNGYFEISGISPGKYDLQVSMIGYHNHFVRNVHVSANYQRFVLIEMHEAAISCGGWYEQNFEQTPFIFAPLTISTVEPEFATTFSPDGQTIYFNYTTHARQILRIYQSTINDGAWGIPRPFPFSDGDNRGSYKDVDPFVSPDGRRLYFSSNRPTGGEKPATHYGRRLYFGSNRPTGVRKPATHFDIWYVERTDSGWSDPVNPGAPVNTDASEIFTSISRDGTLYFGSDIRGKGHRDIYRAEWRNNRFSAPQRIVLKRGGQEINAGNPCISSDEHYLIFSASLADGAGGSDLYISYFKNGIWTEAENLGEPINSAFADFAPYLTPDGKYLFFTSERPGMMPANTINGRPPGDIYKVAVSAFLK